MSTLFDLRRQELMATEQPLAARMRPRTLDEFVGQAHIIGPGRLLRRAIQADQLSSLIFYGPPGTGKTTLARIIANTTQAHFIAINAVLAGVKNIREAIATAEERRGQYGQKTILFVDEVHRFNKAQQDALLPHVENGIIILIGATTENPYFEVNKALVSRSRIFQLRPLEAHDLRQIAAMALADPQRGLGQKQVQMADDALEHLVNVANGDARALLNALELAVETTLPAADGKIHIDLAVAEESIQRRAVLYDKEGDAHFDTISAFIKSLRGSDPDAALYWLAKMVYAGESPRFLFRRMLIFASEDVGLADPQAVQVVTACARAFEYVGLPEGRYPLAQACLYLATAPKSNSLFAFFDALHTVEQEPEGAVPNHLKDGSRDKKGFGHGAGYLYPHAYRDHWVAQQYLPDALQGKLFYQPGNIGYEAAIAQQVARRREAQLAAMLEEDAGAPPEILTFSGSQVDAASQQWLQRTLSNMGQHLASLRENIMARAHIQRHHLLLDLNAGSGLLTWEGVRQTPEGGVYALVRTQKELDALTQMAQRLPALRRPVILAGDVTAHHFDVRFDRILGRNALARGDKQRIIASLAAVLAPTGRVILAETLPRFTQRLYRLVSLTGLPDDLVQRLKAAEEAIYQNTQDPMLDWDVDTLLDYFAQAHLQARADIQKAETKMRITPTLLARWFAPAGPGRPSYRQHLATQLSEAELITIEKRYRRQLSGQIVTWHTQTLLLTGTLMSATEA
jgi:putative ATPase